MSKSRSYSELLEIDSFEDRFRYLALRGEVGKATFGHARDMNQAFYTSYQWRRVRRIVIMRDNNCDLGVPGYNIPNKEAYVHHMNPMAVENLRDGDPDILDPEYLISTTHDTHNAIHYGDLSRIPRQYVPRRPGDTLSW